MAESELSLSFNNIETEVGRYLGYGATSGNWSTNQNNDVERCIQRGLRQFMMAHDWRFLKPTALLVLSAQYSTGTISYDETGGSNEREVTLTSGTWPSWAASGVIRLSGTDYDVSTRVSDTVLTLTSDKTPGADIAAGTSYVLSQADYDLPDKFAYIEGDVHYRSTDNVYDPIRIVSTNEVERLRQRNYSQSANDGRPRVAAIRPKIMANGTTGQRFEIIFFPTPNAAWTIYYTYRVHPDKLDDTDLYTYGGMIHTETILASCLAVAEKTHKATQDVHRQEYRELLARSISMDNKLGAEHILNYRDQSGGVRFGYSGQVTYEGTFYTGA